MKVHLNLAIRPLRRYRSFKVFVGASGVLAVVLCAILSWHVYHMRKSASASRLTAEQSASQISELEAERQQLENFFTQPENAKLHERAAYVNTILDARSFNWTRMFMDMEKVLPEGVRVLKIEPKQLGGQAAVKLTIGAANEECKRKFLSALEQSDTFTHLQLSSVHADQQAATANDIVLELTFIYSRT
jgi:Tfp pilus assembly protein PilN